MYGLEMNSLTYQNYMKTRKKAILHLISLDEMVDEMQECIDLNNKAWEENNEPCSGE